MPLQPPEVAMDYGPDRWAAALTRSHTVVVRAIILQGGDEIPVPIVDGGVTLDSAAAVRGRCDVTLVDDGALGLVPTSPASSLSPYGSEVRLERGIRYVDGTAEYASLGVFRVDRARPEDTGDALRIRIAGLDRSARVIDGRFEEPYQIAAGTNYGEAILETVQAVYPDVVYEFAETTRTTPLLIAEEGADRWAFCQEMATSIGMELFFNGAGTLVLRPVVLASQVEPVWTLAEGVGGVLLDAARDWSREGAFNRVIATGENLGLDIPPPRGVATDNNPHSPTYYDGPFGRVPRFYVSSFLTTDDQCVDAAQAILARELGTTERVEFGAVVNPALSPSDVVAIRRLRAGINENHVIDKLSIPLAAGGEMTGSTRGMVVN